MLRRNMAISVQVATRDLRLACRAISPDLAGVGSMRLQMLPDLSLLALGLVSTVLLMAAVRLRKMIMLRSKLHMRHSKQRLAKLH